MASAEPAAPTDLAPLALLYHENSKINRSTLAYLAESIGEFTADVEQLRRSTTTAKTYPGSERIDFARLGRLPRAARSFEEVLAIRRSVRQYDAKPIGLPTLAALLRYGCGITGEMRHPDHPEVCQRLRAHPSGGALYPIETYLVALAVEGLAAGVYHYHAVDDCLEIVRQGAQRDRFEQCVLTATDRLDAPALVVLSGRWEQPIAKYGERSYRVMLLDAGHVAQNLLLVATALGLGSCPIAGFHDDALAAELGLDPREEPVLYLITLGNPCFGSRSPR